MHRLVFAALFLLALPLNAHAQKIGPSFDCAKAHAPLAQLICADTDMSRLDLRFSQAYMALVKQVGDAGKKQLREEDLAFVKSVQQQCAVPTTGSLPPQTDVMLSCVKTAYEKQRAAWVARLTPPASEEGARSIDQHLAGQRKLHQLGLLPSNIAVDGVYGAATRSAISDWQRSKGRAATGVLTDADLAMLLVATPEQPTSTAVQQPQVTKTNVESPQKISIVIEAGNAGGIIISPRKVYELDLIGHDAMYPAKVWALSSDGNICNPYKPQSSYDPKDRISPITVVTVTGPSLFWDDAKAKGILEAAWKTHSAKCPDDKFGAPAPLPLQFAVLEDKAVEAVKSMVTSGNLWSLAQMSYDYRTKASTNYSNAALKQHEDDLARDNQERQRQMAIALRASADQAAQNAKQEHNQRAAQTQADFMTAIGAPVQTPPFDELNANPFLLVGKYVSYQAEFNSMRTPTEGLFTRDNNKLFVVKDIPEGALRKSGTVVVAGKVVGNTPSIAGMQVPLLQYAKLYVCLEPNCQDFFGQR